ncbi:acetamidase/formamidase family protein [Caldanaerobacter sp.]|uniref:acetamidase/formamidase family protein n=1 Tax=Caldanaerobacter sp. TaxID=2930036 RepID=UPI003C781588
MEARNVVYVDEFTDGILDPEKEMIKAVKDGGYIIANTAPGCWGPMLTPKLKGGHEVTKPVFVENAEVGDAVAIYIEDIQVTSIATASGKEKVIEGRYIGDPFVAAKCPNCGTVYPETVIEGVGPDSIRCANCGADVVPFKFEHGYTMVLDKEENIGVTVGKEAAEKIAANGREYMRIPHNSVQNPAVTLAPHDLVGVISRMRPFLGQLGTLPSIKMPDSHNAGDFGTFLIGAEHEYAITKEELERHRTDGHMDINRVRKGAVIIAPVKVKGAGVYMGDMHAMQGDGEIAGHTTDVAGIVTLRVKVLKGLKIDGPILLPNFEDLPYLARPFTEEELEKAKKLANQWEVDSLEKSYPLSFIGTGANLNEAVNNGLERAAKFLELPLPEVLNRATITGSIEIGRLPGVVTVTFLVPVEILERKGILDIVKKHYTKTEK